MTPSAALHHILAEICNSVGQTVLHTAVPASRSFMSVRNPACRAVIRISLFGKLHTELLLQIRHTHGLCKNDNMSQICTVHGYISKQSCHVFFWTTFLQHIPVTVNVYAGLHLPDLMHFSCCLLKLVLQQTNIFSFFVRVFVCLGFLSVSNHNICFLFSCYTILSFHLLFWYRIPLLFSAIWGEILLIYIRS